MYPSLNYLITERITVGIIFYLLLLPFTLWIFDNKKKYVVDSLIVFSVYYLIGIIVLILRYKVNHAYFGISRLYLDDRFFIASAQDIINHKVGINKDPHLTYPFLIAMFYKVISPFFKESISLLAGIGVFINTYIYSLGIVAVWRIFVLNIPSMGKNIYKLFVYFIPFTISLGVVPLRDTLVCGLALLNIYSLLKKKWILLGLSFLLVFLLRPVSGLALFVVLVIFQVGLNKTKLTKSMFLAYLTIGVVLTISIYYFQPESLFSQAGEVAAENPLLKGSLDVETQNFSGVLFVMKFPLPVRLVLVPLAHFLAPYPPRFNFNFPMSQGGEYPFENFLNYYLSPYLTIFIVTAYIFLVLYWEKLPVIIKLSFIATGISVSLTGLITMEARHKILLIPLSYIVTMYCLAEGYFKKNKTLSLYIIGGQLFLTIIYNLVLYIKIF